MLVFNCKICNKQFTNKRHNRKYCSQICYHQDEDNNKRRAKQQMKGNCMDCSCPILKSRKRCKDCNLKFKQRPVKPQKMNSRPNCSKCGIIKTLENTFSPQEGMWSPQCRKCLRAKGMKSDTKLKQECVDYKGGRCQVCGYKDCLAALDFHHLDPNEKDFMVARKKLNISNKEMKEELDKTVLICSNCHRKEHHLLARGESLFNQQDDLSIYSMDSM